MTPADFRGFVEAHRRPGRLSARPPDPRRRPSRPESVEAPAAAEAPWRRRSTMVDAYAERRLHQDPSRHQHGLRRRAARSSPTRRSPLAPRHSRQSPRPLSNALAAKNRSTFIGTEVPVPGGALEALDHLQVTTPDAASRTVEVHAGRFPVPASMPSFDAPSASSSSPASSSATPRSYPMNPPRRATWWPRSAACRSSSSRRIRPTTSRPEALAALVRDGFAILKVGPWLTFALREALYGLEPHRRRACAGPFA